MTQQDYKIGRDIEILLHDNEVIDVKQKDTEYNAIKDKEGRRIICPD